MSSSAQEVSNCSPLISSAAVAGNMVEGEVLEFVKAAKRDLGDLAPRPGRVMYSSVQAFCRGLLYTLGNNPGPDRYMTDCASIGASLDEFPTHTESLYRKAWNKRRAGSAPLQKNLRWLVDKLGFDLDQVCSSNIAFRRSGYATEVEWCVPACWPVHERVLNIVQPKYILAFGDLSRKELRKRLREVKTCDSFPANHQDWTCEVFVGSFHGRHITVLGVPYLGVYHPVSRLDWERLRRFIQ